MATLLTSKIDMISLVRNDVINNPGNSKIEETYNDVKEEIDAALKELKDLFDALPKWDE